MAIQRYRADKKGEKQANGAIPYYAEWIGGPTLAKIENCPVSTGRADIVIPPRFVYITGEPDTYFSQPAAISFKGKTIRGFITCEDGNYEFTCSTKGLNKLFGPEKPVDGPNLVVVK